MMRLMRGDEEVKIGKMGESALEVPRLSKTSEVR